MTTSHTYRGATVSVHKDRYGYAISIVDGQAFDDDNRYQSYGEAVLEARAMVRRRRRIGRKWL